MKRYPAYKDSGVEWIGEFPTIWEMKKIKHLADIIIEKAENSSDSDFKIALENIESYTGKFLNGTGSFEGVGNYFKKGDVLFNKLRPYLAKVIVAPMDGVAVGELLILRSKPESDKFFLLYRMLSKPFISVVDGATYGAKMPRANWDLIGNLKVPVPKNSDQRVISKYLDHKTHLIDTLIEKKQKQIELLQEQRSAIINQAVTKGLNPNVKMKDSGIEWLGEVPEHWLVVPIKLIVETPVTDGPHETPIFLDEGVPFISAEAIKNDRIDFERKRGYISRSDHERFSKKYSPKIGDIYMVKSGATTGNVAVVETEEEFNIWSPLAVVRPDSKKAITDFIFYFMKSKTFFQSVEISWSFGTQQNIGMGVIENIPIALPPLEEQRKIGCFLKNSIKKIDHIISKTEYLIMLIREYRTTLISEVVTGKIDVRDEVIQ